MELFGVVSLSKNQPSMIGNILYNYCRGMYFEITIDYICFPSLKANISTAARFFLRVSVAGVGDDVVQSLFLFLFFFRRLQNDEGEEVD